MHIAKTAASQPVPIIFSTMGASLGSNGAVEGTCEPTPFGRPAIITFGAGPTVLLDPVVGFEILHGCSAHLRAFFARQMIAEDLGATAHSRRALLERHSLKLCAGFAAEGLASLTVICSTTGWPSATRDFWCSGSRVRSESSSRCMAASMRRRQVPRTSTSCVAKTRRRRCSRPSPVSSEKVN